MISLTKRLRQESDGKPTKSKKEESRVSVRDKLLIKEVSGFSSTISSLNTYSLGTRNGGK